METTVIPFRGLRYSPEKVGDIADVIAPPYDVIKPDERIALEARHPANIIHLILSQPRENDTENDNQYTRAAALMQTWISDGTFVREDTPSYYIYAQEFTAPDGVIYTRRALIAKVKLEAFENRVIFPHEKTHAGPKADRLNLMRTCHANLSPIFLLYSDAAGDIEEITEAFTDVTEPLVNIDEAFGSTHQLWGMDSRTRDIQQLFADKPLLIADGHHRYETALAFRDEMHARAPQLTGYNYMMMNLVRMESPGLAVLAIHRLIQGLSPDKIAHVVAKLPQAFDVQKTESLDSLMQHLAAQRGKNPAFGLYTPDDAYRLLLPRVDAETTGYDRLDVTLLQNRIIDGLFAIETTPEHVSYTADATDAVAYVKGGTGRVALLMNPTPVSEVLDVAMAGQTMPQKSTYFYPKMATGFVLNLLRD